MKVGIVGFGLMGKRRAEAAARAGDELIGYYDPADPSGSTSVARLCEKADAVVVATPTPQLASATLDCLSYGARHILVEKPCAASAREFKAVVGEANKREAAVVPGYTLRHYPGIRALLSCTAYGEPGYMRAAYGHGGGASGWRAERPGGGELLDQGSHLLDLAQCILGADLSVKYAVTGGKEPRGGVEHLALMVVTTAQQRTLGTLSASWVEWAPVFQLRVVYERGCVTVDGLGRTYGAHRAVFHRHRGVDEIREYPNAEADALLSEWMSFRDLRGMGSLCGAELALDGAMRTLALVDEAKAMGQR